MGQVFPNGFLPNTSLKSTSTNSVGGGKWGGKNTDTLGGEKTTTPFPKKVQNPFFGEEVAKENN